MSSVETLLRPLSKEQQASPECAIITCNVGLWWIQTRPASCWKLFGFLQCCVGGFIHPVLVQKVVSYEVRASASAKEKSVGAYTINLIRSIRCSCNLYFYSKISRVFRITRMSWYILHRFFEIFWYFPVVVRVSFLITFPLLTFCCRSSRFWQLSVPDFWFWTPPCFSCSFS